jgi:caffeoyl-CoA O-methyltransferase
MRGFKARSSPQATYLAEHARQDDVLARVERDVADHPRASLQVSPDQGALLTILARAVEATNALEVGTFTGYSAICIGRALPPDGRLLCCEINDEWAEIARRNLAGAGLDGVAEIRVAPALETLRALPRRAEFDLAFVDADKTSYPSYYEAALEKLSPAGLIVCDNTLRSGTVLAPEDEVARVLASLNDRLAADERVVVTQLTVRDGLTLIRRR